MVLGFVLVESGAPSATRVDGIVDRWLTAMAEPSGDRGWSLLSPEEQQRAYDGDAAAYLADVDAADWSRVAWAPASGHLHDGIVYEGGASLLSHPATLPAFLYERRLAAPACLDGLPFGIAIATEVGWFTDPRLASGVATTKWPRDCERAFATLPGARHERFDHVGIAWASEGQNQRVGVIDPDGAVRSIWPGREDASLDGIAAVSDFAPGDLAITWRGSWCDSNSTLLVESGTEVSIAVIRSTTDDPCQHRSVVYEAVLDMTGSIAAGDVTIDVRGAFEPYEVACNGMAELECQLIADQAAAFVRHKQPAKTVVRVDILGPDGDHMVTFDDGTSIAAIGN